MTVVAGARGGCGFIERGIVAGLIAGTTVELFLFATHAAVWPGTYQWIASGLIGKVAFTSASYVWLGLSLHALVSLGWGLIYAALAQRLAILIDRPTISGLLYGLIVFVAMQILTMFSHIWAAPSSPTVLAIYITGHAVFFGLPTALYVANASSQSGHERNLVLSLSGPRLRKLLAPWLF